MTGLEALKLTGDITLQAIPCDETYKHDNDAEAASLKDAPEEKWLRLFPTIIEGQMQQQTEDDPENHFDDKTLTRVQRQNTTVTGRTYSLSLESTNARIEAMIAGVKDPLTVDLSKGVEVPLFANNDPYIAAGFRLRVYDKRKGLVQTNYFYGYVRADGEKVYNGKLQRPQLTIEVAASVHNKVLFTEVFGDTSAGA